MLTNTEFKDGHTVINGKEVKKTWKFISDGTWYDSGSVVVLETDCAWMGGLFRGTRTCSDDNEARGIMKIGDKYEDGELCHWSEFQIYDENGTLVQEAYSDKGGFDGPNGMAFIPLPKK